MSYDFHVTASGPKLIEVNTTLAEHSSMLPWLGLNALAALKLTSHSKFHLRKTSDRRSSICSSTNGNVNEDPDVRR
jgi:hypothetical protein